MAITLDANLGTFVQASASGTVSLTTTNAVSAGAFIVIGIAAFESSPVTVTVAGGGLSWTTDKEGRPPGGGGNPVAEFVAIASAQAPSGLAASTVLTATFSVSTVQARIIGGTSFTGVKTASPVDGTPTGPTFTETLVTPWATASYAIAAGSLLYTVCFSEHTDTGSTPTSPSVEAWQTQDLANDYGAVANYRIESSAGSYTAGGTWGAVTKWTNVAVAYLAAEEAVSPTRTGTASQVNASAGNGSTSVTVPSDATGAVAFWSHWNSNQGSFLNTLTLTGETFFGGYGDQALEGEETDRPGVGVALLNDIAATGSQTLAWAWDNPSDARDEGGELVIVWIKDQNTSDPVRDVGLSAATGTDTVQVTLDTETTDLLLAFAMSYDPNDDPVLDGTVFINDTVVNSHSYDVSQVTPSATSTTVNMTGDNFSAMAAISLPVADEEPTVEYHLDAHNVTPMTWR